MDNLNMQELLLDDGIELEQDEFALYLFEILDDESSKKNEIQTMLDLS